MSTSALDLEVQFASVLPELPGERDFGLWAEAAVAGRREHAELVIRVVDEPEMTELNRRYRRKASPTNVLSFPFAPPPPVSSPLLGDLVVCAPVVRAEAAAQHKPELAHWAHLTVHGVLHLLGFEHQEQAQRLAMEAVEIRLLAQLGFPDPYQTL